MRSLAFLAALALLAFALGCGGGGGDEESAGLDSTAAQAAQAGSEPQKDSGDPSGASQASVEEEEEGGEPSHSPNPPIATERSPGSKAVAPGVPTAKGGDNSIQAFGTEGEDDEATQALSAFEQYMQARVDGDWTAACAAVSEEYRQQLEMLIERAKVKSEGAQKPQGCPETLELLFGKTPKQALEEAAAVNQVLSLRVREDGYAYLIYEDAKGDVKFIAMASEAGAWRVNTPESAAFPEAERQGSAQ